MKKFLLLVLVFVTSWGLSIAQERSVSGKVTDGQSGEAIPGANVVIKGTSTGTITDFNGQYKISAPDGATLVFSYVGYVTSEIAVGSQSVIDVSLALDVTALEEIVVVGYGSQSKKEITSAAVALDSKDFNLGAINDPSQLLQGKVPGLSIYNKGGNPNARSTIRLRGISTVGANTEPLVVVDGVIGASLDNVDPNDIESVNVLKDGSASAIYGSRGSSGVIIVTTKKGSRGGGITANYNAFVAASTILNQVNVMNKQQYIAAGGNDLGGETDWQKEVTQTGFQQVHNIAVGGGSGNTSFRVSTNFREVNGILRNSGFDQVNTRANITHSALNDRLTISSNLSMTNRESNFSFNEALRYAVLFNPTAPIRFPQAQGGGYFQAILFDNFNPVAIIEQNQNVGKRKELNFNTKVDFDVTDNFTVTANYAQQYTNGVFGQFYPATSLFRGYNRTGLAQRDVNDTKFSLFEAYGTYNATLNKTDLTFTGGYSWQQEQRENFGVELGDFPSNTLGFNALQTSYDRITGAQLVNVYSGASPEERIIAFFGRVNLNFDNAVFFNASVRREGSTKLGANNRWGLFPALGLGVDLNRYLNISSFDIFKFRAGYGVTGSLPGQSGLAQDLVQYNFQGGGSSFLARAANPDLKWEEKAEINVGLDFSMNDGKLTGSLDVYNRNIKDFILERIVDPGIYGTDRRFENAGRLSTNGAELSLNYEAVKNSDFSWRPGVVLSTYKTKLKEFVFEGAQMRADLGAPGQNGTNMIRVAIGEEIGQIWGPRFSGNVSDNGSPIMVDLNGDGRVVASQGSALAPDGDFEVLGNGIPDLELGWTNIMTYKKWDFNLFFRGAFGHSLVNNFRAFYEPIDPGAINSYNRVITDKAVAGLTVAQFSSLYVERADFLKLDNATVGYTFDTKNMKAFSGIRAYFSVQNAFVLTKYAGIDPEPVLQDAGSSDNGGRPANEFNPDVLSPGIDRRNNYFTARTFTLGINVGF